jgi:hypothetical protein
LGLRRASFRIAEDRVMNKRSLVSDTALLERSNSRLA